ncbi:MAG: serine hydrolase [Rhodospirillales bacterium]|jgi:CubicO group peptidase (beta-lactamase class C family)|nr:serine hydrolase [Rhodospirillales bacterium]
MDKHKLNTTPNPDLMTVGDHKAFWNSPDARRLGFHNLHKNTRYSMSLRADEVLDLEKRIDRRIDDMQEVRHLTGTNIFSAMVVLRGQHVLYEKYADDFGPDCPHSIMSITKTHMNLIIGSLVADGLIDLNRTVDAYLPDIGTGYAKATIQQVLNMDVVNDYTEDYSDPYASSYKHEVSMGWRLPIGDEVDETQGEFLKKVSSNNTTNSSGVALYKSANTDILGMVAEHASGRTLRSFLAEIVEAAGLEYALHISTDRDGGPWMSGGGSLTARDLARYGSLFVRRGVGVNGRQVGNADFIEATLKQGVTMANPRDWIKYSNQTNTNGRWMGHGGYGGQYMLADLESGVVGVFYSVLENSSAHDADYSTEFIRMLEAIAKLPFKDEE